MRGHNRRRDVALRFWEKVQIGAPDECWPWESVRDGKGYGRFHYGRRSGVGPMASRVAYLLVFGDPGDLEVMHVCDNPPCCNPGHLITGTHADNMADSRRKGRQASGADHWTAKRPEHMAYMRSLRANR